MMELAPVEKRQLRNRQAISDHLHNHEGREFDHAFKGNIVVPWRYVTVGRLRAITYFTDKGNGHGPNNYRHVFGDRHPWRERFKHSPFVDIDVDGSRINFRYDDETTAVISNGWLDD